MGRLIFLRLIDTYFRHRWLYLIPILIMGIAAGVYFVTNDRLYISQGILFIQKQSLVSTLTSAQSSSFSWNTPAQDTAAEIGDLMATDSYIRAVINETDLKKEFAKPGVNEKQMVIDIRKRLWVTVLGQNQVSINASSVDPEVARQLANAAIAKFIQWKINSARLDSNTAVNFFDNLIVERKAKNDAAQESLKRYLLNHPEPVRGSRPQVEDLEIRQLTSDIQFAGTLWASAMEKAESARLAAAQVDANVNQTYFVMDAPVRPDKAAQSLRQQALNNAIFLVVGVILSLFIVMGAAAMDQSIRFPLDVSNRLELPVLAVIPDISETKKRTLWSNFKRQGKTLSLKRNKKTATADEAATAVEAATAIDTGAIDEPATETTEMIAPSMEDELPAEIQLDGEPTEGSNAIEQSSADDLAETGLEGLHGSGGNVETGISAGTGESVGQAEAAEKANSPILVADENTLLPKPIELPESPEMVETTVSNSRNTREDLRSRNSSGKRSKPAKRHYE